MVGNKIINELQGLGFSEYEARAYVSALSLHTASAYEIARDSGIPSSKIYETIARLKEKGRLFEVTEEGKKKYAALESAELLAQEKGLFERRTASLAQGFRGLNEKRDVSFIWNIAEYGVLVEKSLRLIAGAVQTLLVSVWGEEFAAIFESLRVAEKRGVKIAVVHFGRPALSVGAVFPHPIEDTLYHEKGGRGYTLVADGATALTATVFAGNAVEGAWSTNRGFVTLAEDYLKHDVYIMKIVSRFDRELVDRFGENYKMLRDIFEDKEANR